MNKYKLTILYDGTHYGGWQIQPNAKSIQEEIQKAIKILLKKKVPIVGAGRTDAGVHALGQVAHFHFEDTLDEKSICKSLNGILSHDIRIKSLEHVSDAFHARFSSKEKTYHYHLHLGSVHPPFRRLYSHHVKKTLDIYLLQKAAKYFIGTHDFKAFANEANKGAAAKNSIRTIKFLNIIHEGDALYLEFIGDGFLYKMVRNITGTLLDVASHKISLDNITKIFESKDRRLASRAAPSRGLFLVNIKY